jgi:hypothetical protein
MQSDQIDQLATALAVAQGKITGALKDSANPFFKSKYADLASVWDACREALSANGLCVIQTTESVTEGQITVVTTLAHKSGQWIKGVLSMTPKDSGAQAAGSCLTYARRYALAAIVGVAQVDDDANAASTKKTNDTRDGMDIAGQDPEVVQQYVDGFQNALLKADDRAILELHDELKTQAELYTAVRDRIPSKQRTELRNIISAKKAA